MFYRLLFIFILACLALRANAIDCSDTLDNDGCYENPECCADGELDGIRAIAYYCDPYVKGDCSREGIDMLSERGIFITVLNGDPEYGCDDTSCGCYWQDCFVPSPEIGYEMGE